jgi:hypothetical protein
MKAWVLVLAMMVVGSWVMAGDGDKPAQHDAKNPGLDRSGFLPYPRRDHMMKDGILVKPPEDPVEREKWRKALKERREAKEANGGVKKAPELPAGAIVLNNTVAKAFRGHYYQGFKVEGITWAEAKRKCEEMGGHLATITDIEDKGTAMAGGRSENMAVAAAMYGMERAWIGAFSEGGKWQWVTPEMWGARNWVSGEKMGKNDVKSLSKAMDERKRLVSEAESKKVGLIADAKAKADEYVAKADGKKDVYVERAKKKSEDLLWAANQEGDRIILEAKQQAGLAVLKETGVKIGPACVSSGRKSPDGKTEAPMTVDELKDAVKTIDSMIVVDDKGFLNNSVGSYGYMVGSKWNARFDDGGWMAAGAVPSGMEIDGFVCEWESKDDIKEGCGLLEAAKKANPMDEAMGLLQKKMDSDPEFRAKVEAQKAEFQKTADAEKAKVSPNGKYAVKVMRPGGASKVFNVEASNAWEARNKVIGDLNAKSGGRGLGPDWKFEVEFAE